MIQYNNENHVECPDLNNQPVITGLINITVNPVHANTTRIIIT